MDTVPVEILRQILLAVLSDWLPSIQISTDPLKFEQSHRMWQDREIALKRHHKKISLMIICKKWYLIAEEFLYSELYITSASKLITLSNRMAKKESNKVYYGWWTTILYLDISLGIYGRDRWEECREYINQLPNRFPNLRALYIHNVRSIGDGSHWFGEPWMRQLSEHSKYITYFHCEGRSRGILWFDMLRPLFPTLVDLAMTINRRTFAATNMVSFTRVRRLAISGTFLVGRDLSKLEFPCLEWLSLNKLNSNPGLPEFLRILGKTLRSLEIILDTTPPAFLEHLGVLPMLENLVFRHTGGLFPSSIRSISLHRHLELPVHPLKTFTLDFVQYFGPVKFFLLNWLPDSPLANFPGLECFNLVDSRSSLNVSGVEEYLDFLGGECQKVLAHLPLNVHLVG